MEINHPPIPGEGGRENPERTKNINEIVGDKLPKRVDQVPPIPGYNKKENPVEKKSKIEKIFNDLLLLFKQKEKVTKENEFNPDGLTPESPQEKVPGPKPDDTAPRNTLG